MSGQLIIPMSGASNRFRVEGYELPKFLLEVDGQTIIDHVLDMFPGWDDVVFCCNSSHLADEKLRLRERLLLRKPDAKIVSVASHQRGPGWAVWQAREHVSMTKPVVVNYCDFSVVWDSRELLSILERRGVAGCIPAYTGFHPHLVSSTNFAYLRETDGQVTDIQEKQPWTSDPRSEFASSGTYGFRDGKTMIRALQKQIEQDLSLNGELYFSLTYKPLIADGESIAIMPIQHFMQWGTPSDFEEYDYYSKAFLRWLHPRAGQSAGPSNMARIVLAAGKGERFRAGGYDVPKPALQISGRPLAEHALLAVPGDESVLVTLAGESVGLMSKEFQASHRVKVVSLPELSAGQAVSALAGLRELATEGPVTVASCDGLAVVSVRDVETAVEAAGEDGLVVWLSDAYGSMVRRPEDYGWVLTDSSGAVVDHFLKAAPPNVGFRAITGTFTFGSRAHAVSIIEALIASEDRIRGEFYLDSLISAQIQSGGKCLGFQVPGFLSVGTPDEYESVKYWQSAFHKWPMHLYSLKGDPMVEQADIMTVSSDFLPEVKTARTSAAE